MQLPVKIRNPGFFYGYIIVLIGFYIALAANGTFYSFGIFFESILNEFGWTRAVTSGAFSLANLVIGSFSIIMGRLTDKVGPRIAMTVSGLFMGAGLILMSTINTVWELYLYWGVLIAIGVSGAFVPATSVVSRWFFKRRGLMTGVVVAGIGVGTMFMPILASRLISSYDWRTSFWVIGSLALVTITIAAQFVKREPGQVKQLPYGSRELENTRSDAQEIGFSLRQTLRTRQFWIIFAMFVFHGFYLQVVIVHVVIYATGSGLSLPSAANIVVIIGGVSVAGKVMMGNIADRFGSKLLLSACFLLMSITLFWLMSSRETWMFYSFGVSFGIAYGGLASLQALVLAERFGLKSLGANLGVLFFGNTLGGAVGVVLVGRIFDMTESYGLGIMVCALLSLVAFVLSLLLRLTDKPDTV